MPTLNINFITNFNSDLCGPKDLEAQFWRLFSEITILGDEF